MRYLSLTISIFIVLYLSNPTIGTDIYRYEDEEGNSSYSNVPENKFEDNSTQKKIILKPKNPNNDKVQNESTKTTGEQTEQQLNIVQDQLHEVKNNISILRSSERSILNKYTSARSYSDEAECLTILENDTYITTYGYGYSITSKTTPPELIAYCKLLISSFEQDQIDLQKIRENLDILYKEQDRLQNLEFEILSGMY